MQSAPSSHSPTRRSDPIRVLLIGAGSMGCGTHLAALREHPLARVVGVVRRSERAVEGIPRFSPEDLGSAIESSLPDLAIVSSPHRYHYPQVRLCLERGVHVLTEKPLAFEASQAHELVGLAEAKDLILAVNLQRRYEGACSFFRKLRSEGRIGDVRLVSGLFAHRFAAEKDALSGWRHSPEIGGAGILDDSAFHVVDLAIAFAGGSLMADSVQGMALGDSGSPHSFITHFSTTSGATVNVCGSYLCAADSVQEEYTILGTRGSLFIRRFCKSWSASPPEVFYKSIDGSQVEEPDLLTVERGRGLTLQAVIAALAGTSTRERIFTQGADVLDTHRVLSRLKSPRP